MKQTEIYMSSISGETPAVTEALWLNVFLAELRRQAELGSRYIKRAWTRAMSEDVKSNDNMVWGDLQAALFSAIVIQRILKPGPVRPFPKETRAARQSQADHRGRRLRELLRVEETSPLFLSKDVRDACEHFDEKLDAAILEGKASLVDWHISLDGKMLQAPPEPKEWRELSADLRAFYPRGGILRFSAKYELDIFNLDVAFLNLLEDDGVEKARAELKEVIQGSMTFGASQYIYLMSEENEDLRVQQWMDVREAAGAPVPRALGEARFRRET
jgi:hypothetical protein